MSPASWPGDHGTQPSGTLSPWLIWMCPQCCHNAHLELTARHNCCYILSSNVWRMDPNTLFEACRLGRVGSEGHDWYLSTQPLSILPLPLQDEIPDYALCFAMKIHQREAFLVWCPVVAKHNFLERASFLCFIYLFSSECSLNPPFLLGTTAAACGISLPSLNDCEISFILEQDSIKENNYVGLTTHSLHSWA